jgi:hypothetical protein
MGDDMCISKYSQLFIDQGNYIAPPQSAMTSLGQKADVDECAAACAAAGDTCQYFTFVYDDGSLAASGGSCFIRTTPSDAPLADKRLFYKMIPTQDMSAQSVGLKGKLSGKEVSNGWYMRWPTAVGEPEQGFNVSNPPSPSSSLKECLTACDMDASCVLVYFDTAATSAKCLLKSAGVAALHRTAIHAIAGKLVHGAPAPDGAACEVDADCESFDCVEATKTCAGGVSNGKTRGRDEG